MNLEESLLNTFRQLPQEKQMELLEHAEQLRRESPPPKGRRTLRGLWADLNVSVSAEDIDDARREAWKNFPRDL